jgi:hypothetical protein
MRLVRLTALTGACWLASAAPAPALPPPKDLWATVNVCDTPTYQNMMGIRASMPGDADHTKMYMRFAAEYYDRGKQLWSEVKGYPISKWTFVGSGMFARRQGGYTFAFDPPKPNTTFTLRGAVDFKWVKKHHIVRTAHLNTSAGHAGTAGADPKAFSAAICDIKP